MTTKVLVTGAAGFIGRQTVKELVKQGYEVFGIDRVDSQWLRDFLPSGHFVQDEFYKIPSYMGKQVNSIIHLAADHIVPASMMNPQGYYDNNVIKMMSLLQAMSYYDIRDIVFSGSSSVYGNGCKGEALTEDMPIDPMSPYASTKVIAELMLKDYAHAYGLKYVSLRYFNAAGADPECEVGYTQDPATHLVPIMCRKLQNDEAIDIYGDDYPTTDGTCIRDYTHVRDLATAHIKAVDYLRDGGSSEIINLGGGNGESVLTMVQKFSIIANEDLRYNIADRRAGDPAMLFADITKAKVLLKWEPQYTTNDILQHAWSWENNKNENI